MGEILKTWLRTRLGVIMDLTPDIFGHYTRDGTVLAQILHTYDIITHDQLDTITKTQDPALCRVNLKYLRVWLRFLGIDCTDESIEEISCGKGTTALTLFYKVYLCLESKDRLYFITLQKEREKYVPASTKFDVSTVCEDPPPYEPPDHPLSRRLVTGRETVEWHRSNFASILRSFGRTREHQDEKIIVQHVADEKLGVAEVSTLERSRDSTQPADVREPRKEEIDQTTKFTCKHRPRAKELKEPTAEEFQRELEAPAEHPEMARTYMDWLKNRGKRTAMAHALKSKIGKSLLSQLWQTIAEKQEREFDRMLAGRVLDQSRYEKQIVTRLCEVRKQQNVMAENQKVVEDLVIDVKEQESKSKVERERELESRKMSQREAECLRMCELRQRLHAAKIKKIREKHRQTCKKIAEDLLDMSLKIAEYRKANDGFVPGSVISEWRGLFLRSQPLFVQDSVFDDRHSVEEAEYEEDEEEGEEDQEKAEELARKKFEQISAMREAAFEDYHELRSPWNEYLPFHGEDVQEILDTGCAVLGHVVHRLLEHVYPYPVHRSEAPVPRVRTTLLVGVENDKVCEIMQSLLEKSGFKLVRMADAINYCLARYKAEMVDYEYIDLNIVAATNEMARILQMDRKGQTESETKRVPSVKSKKSQSSVRRTRIVDEKGRSAERIKLEDKPTQTPRVIPYDDMDPDLTDAAYIGKWAYEFLVLGQPISNELATKILVQYLKSLQGTKGWVLIDYPDTYEQMARLETAVTGRQLPPDPKILNFEDVSIEDIESVTPRIEYEDTAIDLFVSKRQSKLLPNPNLKDDRPELRSNFASVYVRLAQRPRNFDNGSQSCEVLSPNASSVDMYYAEQKIAYVLYYSALDSTTLKELARLAIGEPFRRLSSGQLFGDALQQLGRSPGRSPKGPESKTPISVSKPPTVRRLLPRAETEVDSNEDEQEQDEFELFNVDLEKSGSTVSSAAKPGDPRWTWIDFPLPTALMDALATLWENLENLYVDELKDLFFLKAVHTSGIVPYKDLVTKNMKEFVQRPDDKQTLLYDFHKMFNAIDEDARDDVGVKCELHRRVADFQARLWDICDRRKAEAEAERQRLINDQWTVIEAAILFNVYVGILQVEMDRCKDTLRIVQDYYMGMLKRPLEEFEFSKVALNRTELDRIQPIDFHWPKARPDENKERPKRIQTPKGSGPAAIDTTALAKDIANLLIDTKRESNAMESSVYRTILDNVRYVRNTVESISSAVNDAIKREEAGLPKGGDLRNYQDTDSMARRLTDAGADLIFEWRYAANYEINRTRLRLDVLTAAAREDVTFLLETVRGTFHRIHDDIVDRYWREMNSVNEMANVFCFAIEEAKPIEHEMLLEGDRFVVRSNVLMMAAKSAVPTTLKELSIPSQFRIAQLARLLEIFRRIAPDGTLPERSLVYILQDLASHEEDGEFLSLPCMWQQLGPRDISDLIGSLFGVEEYVDWREFLIYAMDLPWPSYVDILIARERFRALDADLKETVHRDQFHRTPLWFLDCTDMPPEMYELLKQDFLRNREELFDEELEFYQWNGSFSRRNPSKSRSRTSCLRAMECKQQMRLVLAKELLCQMYLVKRHTFNYTAFLLAFCKDQDPREGFAKALTLAIGSRVCTKVEEGERYVKDLLEEKRLAKEMQLSLDSLRKDAEKAAAHILDLLMDRVGRYVRRLEGRRSTEFSIHHKVTVESLDDPSRQYPSLLPLDVVTDYQLHGESSSSDRDGAEISSSGISIIGESEFRFRDQQLVVYWLPLDVCLSVLAAALPWHVSQAELFHESRTLRDSVCFVYEELRDESLCDEENVVLAHRFLNHRFVTQLLNSTSKFTVKRIGNMVRDTLLEREKVRTSY